MKSIFLLFFAVISCLSSVAQVRKGTQFLNFQANGAYVNTSVLLPNGDTNRFPPRGQQMISFHRAFGERWVFGVGIVANFSDSATGIGGGLSARYYFDFSKNFNYPDFFLHGSYLFGSGNDWLGKFSVSQPGIFFGQTLRRRREMVPNSALKGERLFSKKRRQNDFRRFGFEYRVGVECITAPHRRTVVAPVIGISLLVFPDSKSWAKRSK